MEKGKSLQHQESIFSAGIFNDFKQWHIAQHDVYGNNFIQAWENSGDFEIIVQKSWSSSHKITNSYMNKMLSNLTLRLYVFM
jgi:hypothetical protein